MRKFLFLVLIALQCAFCQAEQLISSNTINIKGGNWPYIVLTISDLNYGQGPSTSPGIAYAEPLTSHDIGHEAIVYRVDDPRGINNPLQGYNGYQDILANGIERGGTFKYTFNWGADEILNGMGLQYVELGPYSKVSHFGFIINSIEEGWINPSCTRCSPDYLLANITYNVYGIAHPEPSTLILLSMGIILFIRIRK